MGRDNTSFHFRWSSFLVHSQSSYLKLKSYDNIGGKRKEMMRQDRDSVPRWGGWYKRGKVKSEA